jgi:hypothetical protein
MKENRPTDPNQIASKVVGETIAKNSDVLPADLEAAWKAWSAGVGRVDARGMLLLKAAFEAGAEAASRK